MRSISILVMVEHHRGTIEVQNFIWIEYRTYELKCSVEKKA